MDFADIFGKIVIFIGLMPLFQKTIGLYHERRSKGL